MINQGGKIIFIFIIALTGFFYPQILQILHSNPNIVDASELININAATLEELDTLPGIGPSKAQAIIDYRTEYGDFQTIEEIKNVSGIGDVTFNNIKDLITVGSGAEVPEPEDESEPESTPEPVPEAPAPPVAAPNIGFDKIIYKYGDVVINEFVADPADGEVEFVELYNRTGQPVDLIGWSLFEGSGAQNLLSGTLEKYFVIEKPKGNLNNAGDVIILKLGDAIIDQVAYGNWMMATTKTTRPRQTTRIALPGK
ncbi:MAG: helix-hairpin-helix domain-containing protein [Patescibacteria group bacterium]|jgi:comEA protein